MIWSEYAKSLRNKCKKMKAPLLASFELTPLCNFDCNMCYIHLSPAQAKEQGTLLSTEQWLSIAKEAKRLGVLAVELTGGEALTRPDFSFLYEEFVKMGYLITIRSNGFLLRGDILELLKKYKPRCVSITLYGASDDTYKTICGVDNGFSIVTQNVINLRDAGINHRLTVTMTKENLDDQSKLIAWAKDNGFFISFYGGLINPIRSAKRSIEHLKIDYKPEYNDIVIPERIINNREEFSHPFWMCKTYGTGFCISWDGRMTLCNCFPAIWSNPILQGVGDAFHSLYEQLEMVRRPFVCANCQCIDYCSACPAKLLSETGNYEMTCDSVCKIARVRYMLSQGKESKNSSLPNAQSTLTFDERNELNEN